MPEKLESHSRGIEQNLRNRMVDIVNGVLSNNPINLGESGDHVVYVDKRIAFEKGNAIDESGRENSLMAEFCKYITFDNPEKPEDIINLYPTLYANLFDLAKMVNESKDIDSAIAVLDVVRYILLGESKNITGAIYHKLLKNKNFCSKESIDQLNILRYIFGRYYNIPFTNGSSISKRYSSAYYIRDYNEKFERSIEEISGNNAHKDFDLSNLYKIFKDIFSEDGLKDASGLIYLVNVENIKLNNKLSEKDKIIGINSELYNYCVNNECTITEHLLESIGYLSEKITKGEISTSDAFDLLDAVIFSLKPNQNATSILQKWQETDLFNEKPFGEKVDMIFSYFNLQPYKCGDRSGIINNEHIEKGKNRCLRYYNKYNDEKLALQYSLSEFLEDPDSEDDKCPMDSKQFQATINFVGGKHENFKVTAMEYNNLSKGAQNILYIYGLGIKSSITNLRKGFVIEQPENKDDYARDVVIAANKLDLSDKDINVENLCKMDAAIHGEKNEFSEIAAQEEEPFNLQNCSIDCSDFLENFSVHDYIIRYEEAHKIAEVRESYGDVSILLNDDSNTDSNNPSGQHIAAGLLQGQNSTTLDSYKISNTEISSNENFALKYSAFDITFNNIFNLDNPLVQKLVSQKIDLRSELTNYGIYNPENNYFNQEARDRFVSEKLQNGLLSDNEIKNLGETFKYFPDKVNVNYKILCGNFHTDQEGFEKIAKIYALGEIIENIKNIFAKEKGNNYNSLGQHMGLELDKEKPADIVGDCLFLKGKIDGTEINIKYNGKTGKLFMNSFFDETTNPTKITIGNTLPITEIGNFDSFEKILDGYNSSSIIQPADNINKGNAGTKTNESKDKSDEQKQMVEKLTENKLWKDLESIGEIIKSKARKEGVKNGIISNFLKTFDFLNNTGTPKNIEFMGSSNIFILLESVMNAQEDQLNDISILLKGFTEILGFERGNNIEYKKESNGTINCIKDEPEIESLKKSVNNFFDKEKESNKNSTHFEGNSSFVSILQEKNCFKKTGRGWEFDINPEFKEFYVSLMDSVGVSARLEEAF